MTLLWLNFLVPVVKLFQLHARRTSYDYERNKKLKRSSYRIFEGTIPAITWKYLEKLQDTSQREK